MNSGSWIETWGGTRREGFGGYISAEGTRD